MILVDDHAHLMHHDFKDVSEVVNRAKAVGVKRIVVSGVNPPTNRQALELTEKFPDILRVSLGIYPIDALNIKGVSEGLEAAGLDQAKVFDVDDELEFIRKNKQSIVAVGEAGLDFKWDLEHHDLQKQNFSKVIKLCEDIKKPIVVHTRKAERECVEMLLSSSLKKVVLHCFEGRKSLIKQAADAGFFFSIPTNIVRSQIFQIQAGMVDLSQITTETDAPYLSPVGGTNEPANVVHSIRKIAEIKKLDVEETANNVFLNFQRVYE